MKRFDVMCISPCTPRFATSWASIFPVRATGPDDPSSQTSGQPEAQAVEHRPTIFSLPIEGPGHRSTPPQPALREHAAPRKRGRPWLPRRRTATHAGKSQSRIRPPQTHTHCGDQLMARRGRVKPGIKGALAQSHSAGQHRTSRATPRPSTMRQRVA